MNETSPATLDLAIVIVNYNTSALLADCLRSVFASRGGLTLAVCVVDNASPDDSVAMTRAEFPQVHVIANATNAGYPQANNQGLKYFGFEDPLPNPSPVATGEGPGVGASLPRFALLLNPDTVLPPDALAEMIAFMAAHPQAGAAGPKLVRLDGSLDKACRRSFPTPETSLYHLLKLDKLFPTSPRFARYDLSYLDPNVVTQVDAIVGAFMLVRREAILQAGLLDESFFMYGEDLDWAKRITDAGWQVWYNPQVAVTHVKEAASRYSYRARVEFYRALIIFYEKHYRATTPFWLDWLIRGGVAFFGSLDLLSRRLRGQRVST
ncbi:MAG: glycosyltransferase family 2 protein [Chloroflexi bacterium]|nr:glycosyltransferase family 2 protein [Chloroflexota bacterium]